MSLRCVFAACVVFGMSWEAGHADDRSAAELLPASTVFYAEVTDPAALLSIIVEHPLKEHAEGLRAYQKLVDDPKFAEFQLVLGFVEAQIAMDWQEAIELMTSQGLAVAFDAETQGAALLAHSADGAKLKRLVQSIIRLAREDARNKGKDDPYTEREYRGITAYGTGKGGFAVVGDWLFVANNEKIGKKLIDFWTDAPKASLATDKQFQSARASSPRVPGAWAYANIGAVREAGAAEKLFSGKADDPAGEILLGGILEALQAAPYATASMTVASDHLSLDVRMPFDRTTVPEEREHYFGPQGTGTAPPTRRVDHMLFSVTAYRNLSEMWLRAGDLFNAEVNDGLAQADTNLSTLFAGKEFGEEILGALSPELQLVGVRQEFSDDRPVPAIKLPAFALIGTMKDPETTRREFRRMFLSLVGFFNVAGAANGQPQMELDFDERDSGEVVSGTFVPKVGEEVESDAAINFNFSPSVAFQGDTFLISSTRGLAETLLSGDGFLTEVEPANTAARLSGDALRQVLRDNREQLIAQNVLKEGHTREEAELEIGTLLGIVGAFSQAAFDFQVHDSFLNMSLRLNVAEQAAGQ